MCDDYTIRRAWALFLERDICAECGDPYKDQMTIHVAPNLPFQYTSFPQTFTRVVYSDTPSYLTAKFFECRVAISEPFQHQHHTFGVQ